MSSGPGTAVPGTSVPASSLVSSGGAQGTQGLQGIQGTAPYTTTTADFTMPAAGSTVVVTVQDASWVITGAMLTIQTAGGSPSQAASLRVQSKSGNQLTLLYQPPTIFPLASTTQAGLMNQLSGKAGDYVGGDNNTHNLGSWLPNFIVGLELGNDATTPATVIDIVNSGVCVDNAVGTYIRLAAGFTKSIAGAWAPGSGANGMGTGLTAAANQILHIFAILNTNSGTAGDLYFDTSLTAANAPAGTTAWRRILSLYLDASAHWVLFRQVKDYVYLQTPKTDFSVTAAGTWDTPLSVPTGIVVIPFGGTLLSGYGSAGNVLNINMVVYQAGTSNYGMTIALMYSGTGAWAQHGAGLVFLPFTDTQGRVRFYITTAGAAGAAPTIQWTTGGWIDARGT